MFNVGSVQGYLKLNTTGWTTPMRTANASINTLAHSFTRMGAVAVGSLFLIERQFGKFDKAIRHATSVSETTNEQFEQMSEMALDASVKWNKAATDTAQAFYFLGSAGLTVTEQMQTFNDTIMLSRAMGSELAQTVEGMVDIVRAFGLEFADSRIIADQLTKTVISSNQVFRDLEQALSYGASTARLTNNTLAETTAMLGVMANAGIKGSMAGTVLRRAMTNLMSPTGDMAELIYELGVNIYDASGKMKPFITIMGDISDRLRGASNEYKNMVFEVLFGRRAIAGQIVLFNYGSAALRKYANEIKNASGTTERVAGKQMKAFTEILGQLWREIQRVAIMVGDTLAPAIERVANLVRERVSTFRDYIKANKDAIAETLRWTAALGVLSLVGPPVVLMLTSLVTQFGLLAKAMVKVAWAGMKNPFTLLLISLYTLVAVLRKEGFWEDVWSGLVKSTKWMGKHLADNFKYWEWQWYKFSMRMAEISKAMTIDIVKTGREGEAARAALMAPWGPRRTMAEMERFSKGFEATAANFTKDLKEAGSFTVDIMVGVADAVRVSLAEDIPKYVGIFIDVLGATHPALDALIKKFEETFAGLSEIVHVFMKKPILGGLVLPGDVRTAGGKEALNRLHIWYKLTQDLYDMEIKAIRDSMKAQTIWSIRWEGGMKIAIASTKRWAIAFADMAMDVRSTWAATIEDMFGGKTAWTFKNLLDGMKKAFFKFAAEIIASDLWYGLYLATGGKAKLPFGTATALWGGKVKAAEEGEPLTRFWLPRTYNPPPVEPLGLPFQSAGKAALGAGKAVPEVTINVTNKGTPVGLRVTGQRFDGKQYVISAVMDELNTNPNFREQFAR